MKIFLHDLSICVMCGMMIVGLIGLPSIIRSWSSSSYPYQLAFAQPATTSNTTTGGVAAQGQRPNFLLETRQVVRSRQEKINQSEPESIISKSIYRLGHSDMWGCEKCKSKGDKWFMRTHICKGASKK